MVIDASAIAAILFDEPERAGLNQRIEADPVRLVSAVTRVEATCVVEGRKGDQGRAKLERFLWLVEARVAAVVPQQAEIACEAFRRYGKGRDPAGLNIGDCFARTLARATSEPLLSRGADFAVSKVNELTYRRVSARPFHHWSAAELVGGPQRGRTSSVLDEAGIIIEDPQKTILEVAAETILQLPVSGRRIPFGFANPIDVRAKDKDTKIGHRRFRPIS